MSPRGVVAAACVTLGLWGVFFAAHGHFAGDSGVKYAQSVALWESGFQTRALPSERAIDPEERLLPYGHFYRHVWGQRQGIYSVVFTALAAPAIGLWGIAGSWLVSFLGVVLVAVGLVRLGERLGVPPWIAPLVCLGATPLVLYATQLQEHTPATGLVVLALSLVVPGDVKGRPFLAGLLVGLAATLRPEGYLAGGAVGLAILAGAGPRVRTACGFALGAALPVAAYWALNWLLSAQIDPLLSRNTRWEGDFWVSTVLVIGWVRGPWWHFLLPVAFAALAGLVPEGRRRPLVGAAVGVAMAYLGLRAWEANSFRMPVGLVSVTPLAGLGLAASVWSKRWRQLWVFAVAFLVVALVMNRSEDAGGVQVGSRLLMPALPVLVFLAVGMVHEDWTQSRGWERLGVAWAPAILLVVGLAVTIVGYRTADRLARDATSAAVNAATCPGRIVAARLWWASQVMTPVLSSGKRQLTNHHEPPLLFERLVAAGETEIAYVSAEDPPLPWRTTAVYEGWLPVRCVAR